LRGLTNSWGGLCRLGEFRIWQLLSLHQFQERIAEQELIIAILKPMLQLIQIRPDASLRAW
jgi:hypothetical protein